MNSGKWCQIIDGAKKVFLDLGFDRASMSRIAQAAGVSKGSLYVYFADKNSLFEAIVDQEAIEQQRVAYRFYPDRELETTLLEFGQSHIEWLCRPGGSSGIRTVMAIAERMPGNRPSLPWQHS